MTTIDPRAVAAAIQGGARTIDDIATQLGVKSSSATLRHTMHAMWQSGRLDRFNTGHKDGQGNVDYQWAIRPVLPSEPVETTPGAGRAAAAAPDPAGRGYTTAAPVGHRPGADPVPGCTVTAFSVPHPYQCVPVALDPEGHDEWERCNRPADDPIHADQDPADAAPPATTAPPAVAGPPVLARRTRPAQPPAAPPVPLVDHLNMDGTNPPGITDDGDVYEDVFASDRIPGTGAKARRTGGDLFLVGHAGGVDVMTARADPAGRPDPQDLTAWPMLNADGADRLAGDLDELAQLADDGYEPPKPTRHSRAVTKLDDLESGAGLEWTEKIYVGDNGDQLPITYKELRALLAEKAAEAMTGPSVRRRIEGTHVGDDGDVWAGLDPKTGTVLVHGAEGSEGPIWEDVYDLTGTAARLTPDSARDAAAKLRAYAAEERRQLAAAEAARREGAARRRRATEPTE